MAVDKGSKFLSDLVLYRTYSATKEDGTKESYEEVVERLLSHHKEKFPELGWEIEKLRPFLLKKQVIGSMRWAQFAGEGIKRNEIRGYNCSFTTVESFMDFAEICYISMCGTGVGYSVQSRHVSKLPVIGAGFSDEVYQIPDTKEGWANSIVLLLENPQLKFDYISIRPAGALLSTGGTASGPEQLKTGHESIRKILIGAANRRLTSLEVHDIVCHIADFVVAGGVRRSALICLFDAWDQEMLECKKGEWWVANPQRARANNSAILHRQDINSAQLFENLMKACYASGAGEPGIVWTSNYDWGTNPCVVGNTPLITDLGIFPIQELENKTVNIWNGQEWSAVEVKKTGVNQPLVKVCFGDGSYLICTPYHRFSVKHRFSSDYEEVQAKDLMLCSKYTLSTEPFKIQHNQGKYFPNAYTYGVAVGDGSVYQDKTYIDLYGSKIELPVVGKRRSVVTKEGYNVACQRVVVDFVDGFSLEDLRKNTSSICSTWDRASILNFIAGLADADGSETKTGGIRIYGTENLVRDCQLLLTLCGIKSSVNLMAKKGEVTNYGVRSRDIWYLQITDARELPTHRLDVSKGHAAKFKGKYQTIDAVIPLEIREDVYCFTELKTGKAVFNNSLTFQCGEIALRNKSYCNLSEVNLSACNDFAEVVEAVQAATILGTLQASYTNFPYISPKWKENCEADALLGVSFTGQAEKWHLIENRYHLRYFAEVAKATNVLWAKKLSINPAARIGTTKPSGSASAFLSTSSGIHAAHAPYYIRRVRIDKSNPICKELEKQLPEEFLETDVFSPSNYVVSIPIKMEGAIMRDKETSIQLLERMKHVNQYWIQPSHTSGDNSHNVSLTVSYKKEEEAEIEQWMWDNRSSYNGISLLPFSDSSYQQMPFEEITKERYEELYKKFPSVDLSKVVFKNMVDDRQGEAACAAGGSCEWKG